MMISSGPGNSSSVKPSRVSSLCLVATVLASCAQDAQIAPVTVTSIGPDGGTALSHDGNLSLVIPAGALTVATDISIRASLAGATATSDVYTLLPTGLTFAPPATLTIAAPGPGTAWTVVDLGGPTSSIVGSAYDVGSGTVIAELSALSVFVVQAVVDPSCEDASCLGTIDGGSGFDGGGRAAHDAAVDDGGLVPCGDASIPLLDGGIWPAEDGGVPCGDASVPFDGGGFPNGDASVFTLDGGGFPSDDASVFTPDGCSFPNDDASVFTLDGGGFPNDDASVFTPDGGGFPIDDASVFTPDGGFDLDAGRPDDAETGPDAN